MFPHHSNTRYINRFGHLDPITPRRIDKILFYIYSVYTPYSALMILYIYMYSVEWYMYFVQYTQSRVNLNKVTLIL